MNKKKSPKIAAVIDIGSNMLKMRISQLKKGEIVNLDRLEYPLRLGHEAFNDGKISFESLRELSTALHGYSEVMAEYGIDQYRVVATTALREASNKDYVVDLLKIQNDMDIRVLEDDQEKTLIYSEILRSLSSMEDLKVDNALISYIGTGSIGMTIFNGKNMIFSQNIPIGSLKLHDMLSSVEDETENFYTVVEEYLDIIIGHIAIPHSGNMLSSLVLTGNEIELIAKICNVTPSNGRYLIKAEHITTLFEEIRRMTPEKISGKYRLTEETAEILYSALVIYNRLVNFTKTEYIICPKIELWDAIIRHMLLPKSKTEYEAQVSANAVSCAQVLANRYHCPPKHAENVRLFACKIFDKMKGIHGLSPKKRLLLELAAILHDCGHYVNSRQHLYSTFSLINNTDIYGMTDDDMLLTAYASSYDEYHVPTNDDIEFLSLNKEKRLTISKLVAIFRLANALDKSQKQKLSDIKVKLEEDKMIITGESDENMYLEKWAFGLCAPFFKEVFGISPILQIKSFRIC